jgi:hypothetical protein
MRQLITVAMLLAVGCGKAPEQPAANTAQASAKEPKRPAYCFFKDAEMKGWSASRDGQGNIVAKGRAFRSDPRYKAVFGPAEISGDTARIAPTIVQNDGYASPDNWWDMSATIPDSAKVAKLTVFCGKKTLAELTPKS